MKTVCALVCCVLLGGTAAADPITTTLEGCVSVDDARLLSARWSAAGTFQAVAFDTAASGCAPTIDRPVHEAYLFDEDRQGNTLTAWLDLANLPACGRRQYDLHMYLDDGVLDPFGLKSLVVDTGVDCVTPEAMPRAGAQGSSHRVPEPSRGSLLSAGVLAWSCALLAQRCRNLH